MHGNSGVEEVVKSSRIRWISRLLRSGPRVEPEDGPGRRYWEKGDIVIGREKHGY